MLCCSATPTSDTPLLLTVKAGRSELEIKLLTGQRLAEASRWEELVGDQISATKVLENLKLVVLKYYKTWTRAAAAATCCRSARTKRFSEASGSRDCLRRRPLGGRWCSLLLRRLLLPVPMRTARTVHRLGS